MTVKPSDGLTYASAGVDIDAGNRMVELIKPLVRATARPGADAEIGGFGGLFDLKRRGVYRSGAGGRYRRRRHQGQVAIETGRHDTIGIDLVAMWVNDLVVQAPSRCSSSTTSPAANSTRKRRHRGRGIARGCREADCALIGGETAEMPGLYRGAIRPCRFLRSARPNAATCCHGGYRRWRRGARPRVVGRASNGFSLVRKVVERSGLAGRAGAIRTPSDR